MLPYVGVWRAHTLGLIAAATLGTLIVLHLARRFGVPAGRTIAFQLSCTCAALLGARLHAMLELGTALTLADLASARGFRYPGGILGFLAAFPLLRAVILPRVSPWRILDINAPAIAAGMAVAKVGCFFHGCCYGTPSKLPWAIQFPGGSIPWADHVNAGLIPAAHALSVPIHPLQLYCAGWSLVVAVVLLRSIPRARYPGQTFLHFLVLHEGGKFVLEFLRAPSPVFYIQVPSLALAVTGATLLLGIAYIRSPYAVRSRGDVMKRNTFLRWYYTRRSPVGVVRSSRRWV